MDFPFTSGSISPTGSVQVPLPAAAPGSDEGAGSLAYLRSIGLDVAGRPAGGIQAVDVGDIHPCRPCGPPAGTDEADASERIPV